MLFFVRETTTRKEVCYGKQYINVAVKLAFSVNIVCMNIYC